MQEVRAAWKIVYIESNRAHVRLMVKLIKESKPACILRAFYSGREAIDLLTGPLVELPDVIVLGDDCGGISGYETLQAIERIAAVKDVPVLMVSAPNRRTTRENFAILGALMSGHTTSDGIVGNGTTKRQWTSEPG